MKFLEGLLEFFGLVSYKKHSEKTIELINKMTENIEIRENLIKEIENTINVRKKLVHKSSVLKKEYMKNMYNIVLVSYICNKYDIGNKELTLLKNKAGDIYEEYKVKNGWNSETKMFENKDGE